MAASVASSTAASVAATVAETVAATVAALGTALFSLDECRVGGIMPGLLRLPEFLGFCGSAGLGSGDGGGAAWGDGSDSGTESAVIARSSELSTDFAAVAVAVAVAVAAAVAAAALGTVEMFSLDERRILKEFCFHFIRFFFPRRPRRLKRRDKSRPRKAKEWWEQANPNIEIKETRARTFSIEFLTKQLNSIANGDLASECSWADVVRGAYPWSSALHYVDTPDNLCTYDYTRDCHDSSGATGRCVVGAINNYTAQLTTYPSTTYNLTQALVFLSHFMGDVHQPLHVGFTTDADTYYLSRSPVVNTIIAQGGVRLSELTTLADISVLLLYVPNSADEKKMHFR
ncbi:Endonuclease 2 [Carex littledalei]|uniref:Aspergillus nuclease S1 n=1 Tax=Carex littledalei TaxID=544730 RepID=A0A833RA63_9POAL|nr:Endonuclease 2 [Carex littledalei]